MFKQYDTLKAYNTSNIYFLQIGSYMSKEEMEKANIKETKYIMENSDNVYYAYIGLTSNKENYEKLKKYYQEKGYDITMKEKIISNEKFISTLEKYDLLLIETEDKDTIKLINEQIIDKYKENVVNG